MRLEVSAAERDSNLGIIRKKVKIGSVSIVTPSKGTKYVNASEYVQDPKRVNEISKRVQERTLNNLHSEEETSEDFKRKAKKYFLEESLNVVITNLDTHKLPNLDLTKTLADAIYAASDKVICLPTVRSSTFKVQALTSGGKPKSIINDDSFEKYLTFQKHIIDEIKNTYNSKDILGVMPLAFKPKYMIKLVDMYFENEIFSFVIDANNSNILNKETDLRRFLSHVADKAKETGSSLSNTYLHAINVGTNNFTEDTVSADDFLSFFSYIDVVGTTSKPRIVPKNKNTAMGYPQEPKKKVFMRTKYSYDLVGKLPDQEPYKEFKKQGSMPFIKKYNEKEQFKEAKKVNELIGDPELSKYVHSKKGISEVSWKKLGSIFEKVKID